MMALWQINLAMDKQPVELELRFVHSIDLQLNLEQNQHLNQLEQPNTKKNSVR